jgi:hypothetical protein
MKTLGVFVAVQVLFEHPIVLCNPRQSGVHVGLTCG